MTMRRVLTIAAVALSGAAAVACRGGQAGPPPAFPPTPVSLAVAQVGPIEDASEYVATLKSLQSTTIQPQAEGQITKIFVKSGDHVQASAPVAEIDSRRQQAAVSSQEAELTAREAAVSYARQQAQRIHELFDGGAVSKQEVEQADTALRTAEASLTSLRAQLQQQQVQLRYYTISAPTSGIVGDVPVRVGNEVTTQTVLTTIDQNGSLELHVNVPIERASELRIGLPVEILIPDGSEPVPSRINFVSPHVDDQTQSVLAKAVVQNAGGSLRPLQYVRARIVWKTTNGLVIPVTAVQRISGQFFAFVAEQADGKLVARQRAIKVGTIEGNDYPVLEGIKPGERVVTSGAQKLADGAPIQELAGAPGAAPTS
jgi:RND family efflux transporter MFP subunit